MGFSLKSLASVATGGLSSLAGAGGKSIGGNLANIFSLGATGRAEDATNAQINATNRQIDFLQQQSGLNRAEAAKAIAYIRQQAVQGRGDIQRQAIQGRQDLAPYRGLGTTAIPRLTDLLGLTGTFDPSLITRTPGYQFGLDQGILAKDRSAAARGILGTGGYGQDLTRFGQDYGMNYFNNYGNQLAGLVGIGQNAANQTGAFGQNAANAQAQLGLNAALGSGQVGANYANLGQNYANQIGQGFGNIGQAEAGGYLANAAGNRSAFSNLTQLGSMFFGGGFGGVSPSSFQMPASPNLRLGTLYG